MIARIHPKRPSWEIVPTTTAACFALFVLAGISTSTVVVNANEYVEQFGNYPSIQAQLQNSFSGLCSTGGGSWGGKEILINGTVVTYDGIQNKTICNEESEIDGQVSQRNAYLIATSVNGGELTPQNLTITTKTPTWDTDILIDFATSRCYVTADGNPCTDCTWCTTGAPNGAGVLATCTSGAGASSSAFASGNCFLVEELASGTDTTTGSPPVSMGTPTTGERPTIEDENDINNDATVPDENDNNMGSTDSDTQDTANNSAGEGGSDAGDDGDSQGNDVNDPADNTTTEGDDTTGDGVDDVPDDANADNKGTDQQAGDETSDTTNNNTTGDEEGGVDDNDMGNDVANDTTSTATDTDEAADPNDPNDGNDNVSSDTNPSQETSFAPSEEAPVAPSSQEDISSSSTHHIQHLFVIVSTSLLMLMAL